jgi:hypothetical protein
MSLRWVRLALGALLAELVPIMILVGLVAALGPTDLNEAQTFAGTLGRWVGPIGGGVATFLVAFWVARSQPSQPLRHGLALGVLTASRRRDSG